MRALVAEHPAHLAIERWRFVQIARLGHPEQCLVRNAAPEEERQPRCQVEIADAEHLAGGGVRRIVFDTEQKARIHEHPLQRELDAPLESPSALTGVKEPAERVDFGRRWRAAIRAARDGRENASRAVPL